MNKDEVEFLVRVINDLIDYKIKDALSEQDEDGLGYVIEINATNEELRGVLENCL